MTGKDAAERLSGNLDAIYGYAFSRLYDKSRAEDLASEILCEVISSAERLRDEQAFWGFVWKIAEHTFRRFLRRAELSERTVELTEQDVGSYCPSPEEEYVAKETESEEIYLLRRELSLLTRIRREICVAYYFDGKSCSQIAASQGLSAEMVKYHLSQIRKQLKEGFSMTRKLGEKSYNPGTFRMNFWGDWNKYGDLCRRKLPGSILLAAYETPMYAEDLSVELGVSMPYLEDELEILEAAGVLKKDGERYRTNLVILTDAYDKAFAQSLSGRFQTLAKELFAEAKALLPSVRALPFEGNDYDDNRLLFGLLNLILVNGYCCADELSPKGPAKPLPLGGHGWVFGHDNDYANLQFNGVTMHNENRAGTAWFSAENYRAIEKCQIYDHSDFANRREAMCDAILHAPADRNNPTVPWLIENGFVFCRDGVLSPNFPTFSSEVYGKVCEWFAPLSRKVADCMVEVSDEGEKLLVKQVPPSVKDQCGDIAKIHHRLDVSAFLLEEMLRAGLLTLPKEKTPLCVWGVRI